MTPPSISRHADSGTYAWSNTVFRHLLHSLMKEVIYHGLCAVLACLLLPKTKLQFGLTCFPCWWSALSSYGV
ncbi:hypothetical protein BDW75DRAFT_197855 [Aspergillus navahoensis]